MEIHKSYAIQISLYPSDVPTIFDREGTQQLKILEREKREDNFFFLVGIILKSTLVCGRFSKVAARLQRRGSRCW